MILTAAMGVTVVMGIPLFGMFERTIGKILLLTAACFLAIAAFTSLFVMVVMVIQERAVLCSGMSCFVSSYDRVFFSVGVQTSRGQDSV